MLAPLFVFYVNRFACKHIFRYLSPHNHKEEKIKDNLIQVRLSNEKRINH